MNVLTYYDEARTMQLFREEFWKEGYEEGWKEGYEKGWKEGFQEGEKKMVPLIMKLLSMGKKDDAIRVTEDEEYREKLYREYGITGSVE